MFFPADANFPCFCIFFFSFFVFSSFFSRVHPDSFTAPHLTARLGGASAPHRTSPHLTPRHFRKIVGQSQKSHAVLIHPSFTLHVSALFLTLLYVCVQCLFTMSFPFNPSLPAAHSTGLLHFFFFFFSFLLKFACSFHQEPLCIYFFFFFFSFPPVSTIMQMSPIQLDLSLCVFSLCWPLLACC